MKHLYITLLIALTGLLACKKKEEATVSTEKNKAIEVVARPVVYSTHNTELVVSAEVRGSEDVQLVISMGGRVEKVPTIGQKVKKGDSLCDIDSKKYEALFRQAEAAKNLTADERIRMKDNVSKGSLGQSALQKAELDYWSSEVGYRNALIAYEDSRCISPISGVVVSRQIEKFQALPPGAPTIRVAALGKVEVVFYIPEQNQGAVKLGQEVEFFSENTGSMHGKVSRLDKAIDLRNRTVIATAMMDNPGEKYQPGSLGQVRIETAGVKSIWVPIQALIREGTDSKVVIVKESKAVFIPVQIGVVQEKFVQILSGLNLSDNLVVEGAFKLSDGDSISISAVNP